MKIKHSIFFLIFVFQVAWINVTCAQSGFHLTVEIVNYCTIHDTVILRTTSKEIQDTMIMNSNKFIFNGHVSEPSDAFIIIKGRKYYIPLVNDNINLKIINGDSLDIKYSRSRVNENWTAYFEGTEEYLAKYKDIGSKYSDKASIRVQYQLDSLAIDFMGQVLQKYTIAEDIDGLALFIDDLAGLIGTRNHPELIQELYSLLPDSLQNRYSGKRIKLYLDQTYKINIGQNIDFNFKDISGQYHSLKEYSGKFVLLEFWASWCGPCMMQIPFLKTIHAQQSNKIEIISISIDNDLQKWREKVAELNIGWINIHYNQDEINLEDYFYIRGVPYNILLSQEGRIIRKDVIMGDLIELLK